MKALPASIIIAVLMTSGTAVAKDKPSKQSADPLNKALAVVAEQVTPPGLAKPKVDRDQGDDHANPGAILRVCSKDTPAAQRSAICPTSESPN